MTNKSHGMNTSLVLLMRGVGYEILSKAPEGDLLLLSWLGLLVSKRERITCRHEKSLSLRFSNRRGMSYSSRLDNCP